MMGFDQIPAAFYFFLAAIAVPFIPVGRLRGLLTLAIPVLVAYNIWQMGFGTFATVSFMGFDLELMRVDSLSRVFTLIFCLAAFLGNLYAWHLKDTTQQVAALLYAGSAIGAALAGDLITLFFYWEGTAIASVFLIWARGSQGAYNTGMRYLLIQIGSGVILIAGVALYFHETGSITFENMKLSSLGTWLIFLSFGIKAAFPLLHNWLQDSYPAATVTGTVILSAFTTKLAIYALARGFAGTEILIYIGAVMTFFPIFFAEIENDLRKVLAYSLNNQLGFMVVGVGIGTEMALNGTAAHAFVHILYKALLFMTVGAVLFRTGTSKASELGGLYRTMPLTATFCLIGAASISAFPLFSGFIAKSLILSEAAYKHYDYIWLVLVFASAGVLSHSGIKIPFFTFFAHDSGKRPAEAPAHMLLAMGITAVLCIFIGVVPSALYSILPYAVDYVPYTTAHVIGQLQLLLFALLAFGILYRIGMHPPEIRATNLDTDWLYRRMAPSVVLTCARGIAVVWAYATSSILMKLQKLIQALYRTHGPEGRMARVWLTGSMVLWLAVILLAVLLVNYIS